MPNSECRWECPSEWSEWSNWLSAGLYARNRWRLPVLMVGLLFASGRRTVTTWLRAHADKLRIDPNRITAGGSSAGGHVALCTALLDQFADDAGDDTVCCRPAALVLFNPVVDTGPQGIGYTQPRQRYREICPILHVHAGAPPTIIIHGTHDTTIPVAAVGAFQAKMIEAGNHCEVVVFDGEGQGFSSTEPAASILAHRHLVSEPGRNILLHVQHFRRL